jgi:hypothetical protein
MRKAEPRGTGITGKQEREAHLFHPMCLGKGGDFHFAVLQARFVHDLFESAGGCVVDPLFPALRAEGRTHSPHDHDPTPQVSGECSGTFRFVSAAKRAGVMGRVHGFRLVR